jgi:hypothetical protein
MAEEPISLREYARRRDCSEGAVRRAIGEKKIDPSAIVRHPTNNRPMIIQSLADISWAKTIKGAQNSALADKLNTNQGSSPANPTNNRSMVEIKRMISEVELQLKALELRERKGQLVDKDKVYAALFNVGKEMRQNLEIIPDRIIDDLFSAPSRNEAHTMLAEAIAEALEKFAEISNRELQGKR